MDRRGASPPTRVRALNPPSDAPRTTKSGAEGVRSGHNQSMHFSPGTWIAVAVAVVALLALALFHAWATVPLLLVLIVGLAVARIVP